jgi:lauroyl/myristoyl acyltransferase
LTDETHALRVQVARQVWHWRAATVALQDMENFASAAAWQSVEQYLDVALRRHLGEAAARLEREAEALVAELRAASTAAELEELRVRVIRFRQRYLQVETALEFFGHAAGTFKSLAVIALSTGAPVMPASCWREPDGRHVLRFEGAVPLIDVANVNDAIHRTTREFNAAIERLVLRHPEQWWWVHRRWKSARRRKRKPRSRDTPAAAG